MTDAKNIIEEHGDLKAENDSVNELLEEANAKIEDVTATNVSLSEELTSVKEELEKALAENAELSKELLSEQSSNEELTKKVDMLTQEDDALEQRVSETLNEIGVDPVSIDSNLEEIDHGAEWAKISDPALKTKYYREHKEKILGGIN